MLEWFLRGILVGWFVWFIQNDDPQKYFKLGIIMGSVFLVVIILLILAYYFVSKKEIEDLRIINERSLKPTIRKEEYK